MKKRVVIIGGFHKVKSLSASLMNKGYTVTAINANRANCELLAEIPQLDVFYGDGTEPYILESANVQDSDIVIALTNSDADNLVVCELCKSKFGVQKAVSLISDPDKTEFFIKMGVDSVVCEISSITSIIEQQAFLDEISTLVPIGGGRIKISQVQIPNDAPCVYRQVMELALPKNVLIGCIMRGDEGKIPRGDTVINPGDVLVLISANENESEAHRVLLGRDAV
ncbi:MAG: NAD-binding protein [Oscillospiraceae bacterium]|jgi:trk system potassium uptake protein TrkA|nr:NAD-binding protein [Oscillospiraceae bacterium]